MKLLCFALCALLAIFCFAKSDAWPASYSNPEMINVSNQKMLIK